MRTDIRSLRNGDKSGFLPPTVSTLETNKLLAQMLGSLFPIKNIILVCILFPPVKFSELQKFTVWPWKTFNMEPFFFFFGLSTLGICNTFVISCSLLHHNTNNQFPVPPLFYFWSISLTSMTNVSKRHTHCHPAISSQSLQMGRLPGSILKHRLIVWSPWKRRAHIWTAQGGGTVQTKHRRRSARHEPERWSGHLMN